MVMSAFSKFELRLLWNLSRRKKLQAKKNECKHSPLFINPWDHARK